MRLKKQQDEIKKRKEEIKKELETFKRESEEKLKSIRYKMKFEAMVELWNEAAEEYIKRRVKNGANMNKEKERMGKCRDPQTGRFHFYSEGCSRYESFINWYITPKIMEKEKEIDKKMEKVKEEINLSGPLINIRGNKGTIKQNRNNYKNNNLLKMPTKEELREQELAGLFGGRRLYKTRRNFK